HLGIGIELLDGMTDQVGTGMSNDFLSFFVTRRNDRHLSVVLDHVRGVYQYAVDLAGYTSLGKSWTDAFGQSHDADGFIESSLTAIRQCHDGHENILSRAVVIHTKDHMSQIESWVKQRTRIAEQPRPAPRSAMERCSMQS